MRRVASFWRSPDEWRRPATVLLSGESGVGKEVVARYIHQHSSRCRGPFVAINCAAIPDSLLEATLFGYEKGAFSGAQNAQAGKFEQAQKGTLLLDEITEMPLALQAKLLRVLQEREVERVGGKQPLALDIRVVATSNRDIATAVAKGLFREDLFYRLNVFPLLIPALRQRIDDILPLARHFLADHGGSAGRPGLRLAAAAEDGPAAARLAGQRARTGKCHAACGHPRRRRRRRGRCAAACGAAPARSTGRAAGGAGKPAEPSGGRPTDDLREVEREHILDTLAAAGGSRKMAGQRLGMPERTLRYKLRQYRLEGFLES
jgi:two-component system response regulator FlrC